jgi:hypothetical protein
MILTVSPVIASEQGGVQIGIKGRGFKPGIQVFLGDSPCGGLNYVNETSVTCTVSGHPQGRVDVSVVNSDSSCSQIPGAFEYFPSFRILPKKGVVSAKDQFQFKVEGGVKPYFFSVVKGSGKVNPKTGLYTASEVPGTDVIWVGDARGLSDIATFEIQGASRLPASQELTISPSSNPVAIGGSSFLSVVGGVGPYQFFIDSSLGVIDEASGRLTAFKVSDDVKVTVRDRLLHEVSIHLKFIERLRLAGPEAVALNQVQALQVQGGVPPYTFEVNSGLGKVDPTGQFTGSDRASSTVVTVKDSMGNLGQFSILTVPPLSLSPAETEAVPGGSVRFIAGGGFGPYVFRVAQGLGHIDSASGLYTAPETGTSALIEVKDSHGVVATAKSETHSSMVPQLISSALNHTCSVIGGAAKCWGENRFGQLGDGSFRRKLQPVTVSGLERHVASVVTGYRHSCGLLGTGEVRCWGDNSKGQLGVRSLPDGDPHQSSVSHRVDGLDHGVIAIAAGRFHTCALRDSKVFCWGDNSRGQLAGGFRGISTVPVQVSEISGGAQAITAGAFHSCAIVKGGAKCWGANSNGQLGNRSRLDSESPVNVFGMSEGVQKIESKGNHTCAQARDSLYCWGYNAWGQLGDRSTTSSTIPVSVSGLEGPIEELSLGAQHTCVRMGVAPEVRCWGHNYFGQIGKVGVDRQSEPWAIPFLRGVTALGAGAEHSCVLIGELYLCWGHNWSGQLGNNTTRDFWLPEPQEKAKE